MSRPPFPEIPSDETWLAELRGPVKSPPHADAELAATAGWLIRARYDTALREVRAAPDPELTRKRILARARATTQRPSRRWLAAAVAGSAAGLAAGIIGTLLLTPPLEQLLTGDEGFPEVAGSQEVAPRVSAPAPLEKSLSLTPPQRTFVVRSRNVPATAARLAALLAGAGASLRVRSLPGNRTEFEIAPLDTVPERLARAAQEMRIEIPAGTPVEVTLEEPEP